MGPERLGLREDFLGALHEEIRRAEESLGKGKAKDYPAYLATVEQIEAFRRAGSLFEKVLARYVREEELEA